MSRSSAGQRARVASRDCNRRRALRSVRPPNGVPGPRTSRRRPQQPRQVHREWQQPPAHARKVEQQVGQGTNRESRRGHPHRQVEAPGVGEGASDIADAMRSRPRRRPPRSARQMRAVIRADELHDKDRDETRGQRDRHQPQCRRVVPATMTDAASPKIRSGTTAERGVRRPDGLSPAPGKNEAREDDDEDDVGAPGIPGNGQEPGTGEVASTTRDAPPGRRNDRQRR